MLGTRFVCKLVTELVSPSTKAMKSTSQLFGAKATDEDDQSLTLDGNTTSYPIFRLESKAQKKQQPSAAGGMAHTCKLKQDERR